eukprot:1193806-Prorocentrum_minimum.AAC.4
MVVALPLAPCALNFRLLSMCCPWLLSPPGTATRLPGFDTFAQASLMRRVQSSRRLSEQNSHSSTSKLLDKYSFCFHLIVAVFLHIEQVEDCVSKPLRLCELACWQLELDIDPPRR